MKVFRVCSMVLLASSPLAASAQSADFQIVWINVGEVAAAPNGDQAPRAGRQLFMAPDLVQLSLKNIMVARVNVEPSVISMVPGEQLCLTWLHIIATSHDRAAVEDAPITVSVRQDQRERLSMTRTKSDICFTPTSAGEYPVRFNSLLPARDGTTRGAQIFLRVQGEDSAGADPAISTASGPNQRQLRSQNALRSAS
jgi:hypothetical protein